ncbi:MAG: hypothetical protein Q9178_007724 [Gyalolechia marmorata]
MSFALKRNEVSDISSDLQADLNGLTSKIRELQSWRRRVVTTMEKIRQVIQYIHLSESSGSCSEDWAALLEDYDFISTSIQEHSNRLESMVPVVTFYIQLIESRRALGETTNVTRLTVLAIVFVPLSYIATIFSMNEKFGPGGAQCRSASSSSSTRWQTRQGRDKYATKAKVEGLKSRAAYKLLQINEKHKIFKPGQTVVDLGYAPGSWSQVAVDRTRPNGRVLGIDVIPAQPPAGVSTIQGNFLSAAVRNEVKKFLRADRHNHLQPSAEQDNNDFGTVGRIGSTTRNYLEQEKQSGVFAPDLVPTSEKAVGVGHDLQQDPRDDRMVDVVLSDMSAPWEQTEGFWKRSLSDPYYRMMNTSGINFRDHAGSMDLCDAALRFAFDTLRSGGHFVCKFYQGAEDKALEARLKILFSKLYRDKPESSRSESKESFFVGLRRKEDISSTELFN